MEVVRFGFMNYAIRAGAQLWWRGSTPNWSQRYWTRFLFKGSAIKRAKRLMGHQANGGEVVWTADR